MLSDNKMDSDKSSGVPISLQMSTLYLPCDDAYTVATYLKQVLIITHIKCKYFRENLMQHCIAYFFS